MKINRKIKENQDEWKIKNHRYLDNKKLKIDRKIKDSQYYYFYRPKFKKYDIWKKILQKHSMFDKQIKSIDIIPKKMTEK